MRVAVSGKPTEIICALQIIMKTHENKMFVCLN